MEILGAERRAESFCSKVQLIDPKTAEEILCYNTENRKIDRSTVELYSEAMKRGEWKLSHQGIAIDVDGILLDGQHRLAAVIKSGISVPMLVVRGVERSTFSVMDTGKRRTASDNLRMLGVADVYNVAATLRYVYLYDTLPVDAAWTGSKTRLTNDQILELHTKYPDMAEYVKRGRLIASAVGIITSACSAGGYVTWRSAPELDQSEWFNGIISGANLDEDDPRLRFRNFFVNARAQGGRRRMDAREHLAIYLKAWNLWRKGEKRQLLSFRKGEAMPKPVTIGL
nr:hypothetical protein [Kibdelosporangium sp. MJ126-NF4]